MFKKLKQRIEEEEQQQPVKTTSSIPKKNGCLKSNSRRAVEKVQYNSSSGIPVNKRNIQKSPSSFVKTPTSVGRKAPSSVTSIQNGRKAPGVINGTRSHTNGFGSNQKYENKWEKRRISSSLSHSSRESLVSVDSVATTGTAAFSRVSFGGSSSTEGAPFEPPPLTYEDLCDAGTKEEILSELGKKNDEVTNLENKMKEMSHAFMEQSKQKDRLEEALENLRNEMISRTQSSSMDEETLQSLKEEYENKLMIKDQQIKEYKNKHLESNHLQTEKMRRKSSELVEQALKVERIEKEYKEQKLEFENLQRTLNDISNDRNRYEMQIKHMSMQVTTLEKDKSTLKFELSNIIDELTQKSSMLGTLQSSADKAHEEALSIQQTYNLYKAKAMADLEERESEVSMWKEKIHDLHQKLEGSKLSENDQIKALEKENRLLEKRLQEAREQVSNVRNQSSDQISSLNSLVTGLEHRLDEAENNSKTVKVETHLIETLRNKVRELEQKCLTLKTEKMELEIVADKASFLESQNNLLDTRFKEAVDRLEADRCNLENKIRELQTDGHKNSYRQDHTNRRKLEQLETKVEDQNRNIAQYQERLEELVVERDAAVTKIKRKDEENIKASNCLEDAMVSTNELKKEISLLEESLKEKDDLIRYIKETRDERFSSREKDLVQRDEEIEELQRVLQDRDEELAAVSEQFHKLQENCRSPRQQSKLHDNSNDIELQRTVARLTNQIQELENQKESNENVEIERRTLKAELDEANKKIRTLQQNLTDLKKHYQKNIDPNHTTSNGNNSEIEFYKKEDQHQFIDVNFKYLKHVILKYMCASNDQSRQLVGVIGHLLQFTPRESSIVRDCFEWKLPMEK